MICSIQLVWWESSKVAKTGKKQNQNKLHVFRVIFEIKGNVTNNVYNRINAKQWDCNVPQRSGLGVMVQYTLFTVVLSFWKEITLSIKDRQKPYVGDWGSVCVSATVTHWFHYNNKKHWNSTNTQQILSQKHSVTTAYQTEITYCET